jgi:hypothetical protein
MSRNLTDVGDGVLTGKRFSIYIAAKNGPYESARSRMPLIDSRRDFQGADTDRLLDITGFGLLGQVFSRRLRHQPLYCEVDALDLATADPFPYSGTFR